MILSKCTQKLKFFQVKRCITSVSHGYLGFTSVQNSTMKNPSNQRYFRFGSTSPGSSRPFQILGLQQVAIGSTDAKSLQELWMNVFGLEKIGDFISEKENVSEDIVKLGHDENGSVSVEIDLMCPLDEEKSPKVHKPPLNHIGLWVDDLKTAVEWMEQNGVRFTPGGIRKGAAGYDITFIHPKGNETSPIGGCGVLIELVQAPDEVIEKLKK